ncbi:sugar ABC transporter ATP-binding protein [Halobacteriovorax marinus]|uniref:Sugar ABC transporter ATP-binding protein n=1 Tax=Halobacteriovorax marinus TaxID=97084 RepID=A0A1Y5F7Y5_9BACT|nr:sugar ABC transporter ATP-binding protein [Halobacteriovorax marinus]
MIKVSGLEKEFKIMTHKSGMVGATKNLFSRKHTTVKAVADVNFEIQRGECVGYLGPNGAGKSTTIKMLTGILVPTRGSISVNGITPFENRKENAKQIGVVFGQRTQLWWDLPPIESFDLLGKIYKVPSSKLKKNIDNFIDILDLEKFLHTPVRKLSLGQKMRCELAAALLHDPEILYLDEPTIGLDVMAKDSIRQFLKKINEEDKVTILLTTHDLDDVESLCKRVMVIDNGKLIHDDSIASLKGRFGNYKNLELDLENDEEVHLPVGCELVRRDGKKIMVEFNTDIIKAPELITNLAGKHSLIDLSVHERPIEEVIKRIYQTEV